MSRCLVYARVSSARQGEEGTSLETQVAACLRYATERGWSVIDVVEEVRSAKNLHERPKLSRVRERLRAGEADVLLCYALDRLSRSQAHVHILDEEARRAGWRFDFVTETFEDTAIGRFIRGASAFAAELEREKLRERSGRGVRARVEGSGGNPGRLMPGATPPFGYRFDGEDKGRLAEDEATARVVRRIFQEAAAGVALRAIGRGLTEDSIPSPRAGPDNSGRWHPPTVRNIVTDARYHGVAVALRTVRVENPDGSHRRIERPEDERVALPAGTVPPLVDIDLWRRANTRIPRNRAELNRPELPTDALLRAGHIYCGSCQNRMNIGRQASGVLYKCQTASRLPGRCRVHSILAADIDAGVWEKVLAIVTRPERLREEWERQRAAVTPESEVAGIVARLTEVERGRGRLSRAIAAMGEDDDLEPLLAELRRLSAEAKALTELRERAADTEAAEAAGRAAVEDAVAGLARLAAEVREWDYRRRREALAELDVRVAVYPKGHESPWRWVMLAKPARAGYFPILASGPVNLAPPTSTTRVGHTCSG